MPDVEPHLYPTVIREMIRHENDVTNRRIMWLLIVQGLIANACVTAGREQGEIVPLFASVGILVTLLGMPSKRIKGWRTKVWPCPWIGKVSELLEPFFFLPTLLVLAWLFVLLRQWLALGAGLLGVLSALLAVILMSVLCLAWVRVQGKEEK